VKLVSVEVSVTVKLHGSVEFSVFGMYYRKEKDDAFFVMASRKFVVSVLLIL